MRVPVCIALGNPDVGVNDGLKAIRILEDQLPA